MSAIPDYGLKDENGKQILNRDPRFNHRWYASKTLLPYDNNTMDDVPASSTVEPLPDTRGLPMIDSLVPMPIL